jgi:hypothetical protein
LQAVKFYDAILLVVSLGPVFPKSLQVAAKESSTYHNTDSEDKKAWLALIAAIEPLIEE